MSTIDQYGEYAKTLPEAINKAMSKEWENGMATLPVTVEHETHYLKVIRKCGDLERPECLLFKVVPKNGRHVNYEKVAAWIKESLGIYGDIEIQFKGHDNDPIKTALVDTQLVDN